MKYMKEILHHLFVELDKLKANKIESFLQDETASGINPLGGVELKVFSMDRQKANEIVEEFKI